MVTLGGTFTCSSNAAPVQGGAAEAGAGAGQGHKECLSRAGTQECLSTSPVLRGEGSKAVRAGSEAKAKAAPGKTAVLLFSPWL